MSFLHSNANGFSLTPFGMSNGVLNGMGHVASGPMGVATSLHGPMPISPANTINRLGVASPFASPFGTHNPIQPNSFGVVNPFDPLSVTPYDPFNGAPFGSFGPHQNPIAPTSYMQGGAFSNSLLNPVSLGQNFGSTPLGHGGLNGSVQAYPQQQSELFSFLSSGGGDYMMSQVNGSMPIASGAGGALGVQGLAVPHAQTIGIQAPSFNMGSINPWQQQQINAMSQGGAGGRLVSPFGTFITSIGPMGGNANAGFLGAQAAGQASSIVFHPLNPGMVVDYANPYYSSFNFNQGFFAA